ncbi:hypothetical protein GQ43DRAFT_16261 [Delitschia confertaspora ATCC 74209]|uniref:Myb-like domain-containing protein n=1 Tax=Delitschia confertaspora ATCC 74209 TaxID=1513339 RepID=A0A9P4JU94_9PLEO|nr:hypothetical protein GQ43DRAFT_16261 [Delitschia confertaspora ATCC 74209]
MEPIRDIPWQEHEKVYLLTEIIKAAPLPSSVLYGLIRDYQIQPKWNDIALPHGRSLRSCQAAYQDITRTYSTPDYRHQQRTQLPPPIIYPGPDISKKRSLPPEPVAPFGVRPIRPRTDISGDPRQLVPINEPVYTISAGEPPNKKKRGRPTKAETEARQAAAAARGETYPPPRKGKPAAPILSAGQSPPGQGPLRAASSVLAPMAPFPSASTPQYPTQPEEGSESTSSKRKRSKPTPLELEKSNRNPSETKSPSIYGPATGDTSRTPAYSSFTPISAPLPSANELRDRDIRMEGAEESQPRTTTPRSFKDTVGI